ncbi:MAG: choline kinase [Patescibacteria group bacterium]|jgi:thiamine kinase-like enzyme|nr:choline kinase [Patescibacteria group bacterium]
MNNPTLLQLSEHVLSLDPSLFGLKTVANPLSTQLNGGHHNANFLISFENDPERTYVLRFFPDDRYHGDIIAVEYEKLRKLNGFLSPKVIALTKPEFLTGSLLIMEFIPGIHKPYHDMDPADIRVLAKTLATLHSHSSTEFSPSPELPPRPGTYLDSLDCMIKVQITDPLLAVSLEDYPESQVLIPTAMEALDTMTRDQADIFKQNAFSLLHGDPGPENVVWGNEKITLIDWTESGYGDPAGEIAYLFAVNHLLDDFKKIFLDEYLAHSNDHTFKKRLPIYTLKSRIADLAWSIIQLEKERTGTRSVHLQGGEELYRGYYNVRVKALQELVDSMP